MNFDRLIVVLATGFGVGFSKKAPGTLGSLVGIPFAVALAAADVSLTMKCLILSAVILFGFYITARVERIWQTHDDQRIVIDEIVGQMIVLAWFPPNLVTVILGFALFRLFDIWKPGPIGWIDSKAPGAWGTFFDDVLAGIAGALVLYFIQQSGLLL